MRYLPRDDPMHLLLPLKRLRGREGGAMTVLAGIRFKDGLVVASDSQETEDEYLKRLDVRKVYGTDSVGFEDARIILAGTGDAAHIERLIELIRQEGWEPDFTRPRNVADVAENCVKKMVERY